MPAPNHLQVQQSRVDKRALLQFLRNMATGRLDRMDDSQRRILCGLAMVALGEVAMRVDPEPVVI